MPKRARIILLALTALGLAVPASASARTSCPGANQLPSAATLDRARGATLCLLNRERRSRGLPPLRANVRLRRAASTYSRSMVRHRFFDHVSPIDGSTLTDRVRKAGYLERARAWHVGENLAWGTGDLATPARIVEAWMNSPGHRQNILTGRYREVGIGIVLGAPQAGGRTGATYTTEFGARG